MIVSELDWDVGQPNGGETQNFVSFKVTGGGEKSFLGDEIENIKQCAYCSVSGNNYTSCPSLKIISITLDHTILTLWGVCKSSYLGRK